MTITIAPMNAGMNNAWEPEIGERTQQFIASKSSGRGAIDMSTVLTEAKSILGHCIPPTAPAGSSVVLVVGYVQSGKTLSFTTLSSLAADNGFGVVILLAGTTTNLKGQSEARLRKDFGLDELQRSWKLFDNPEVNGPSFPAIQSALKSWKRHRDGAALQEKPALVLTVLKHAGRVENAAAALKRLDLSGVPVLIIDDESDQATPNTRARRNRLSGASDESPTYSAVASLRAALPHHSFVQYTATPQANLLLATADRLDPHYAKVLSSGPDYTGGRAFFQDRVKELVVVVPDAETYDPRNPLTEPPQGLQDALRVFLLGIADASRKGIEENRSMMVQAHQNTAPHRQYRSWIRHLLEDWQKGIEAGGEYRDEVLVGFQAAYEELAKTVEELGTFEDLISRIPELTEELRVVEVNSTQQAEKDIDWTSDFYWLLIGGMKLDRGFTVEGLTVTYMPRPIAGNADVLQQRARFFGYRAAYIDYCRVYLRSDARDAFVDYVDNEEFLRAGLKRHEGKPLSVWKRDFVLHGQFASPTRTAVIGRRVARRRASRQWAWPKWMHLGEDIRLANEELFAAVLARTRNEAVDGTLFPDAVDRRSGKRNLAVTGIELEEALEFLLQIRAGHAEDSMLLQAIAMQLARVIREPRNDDPKSAALVFMSELDVPAGPGRQLSVVQENLLVGMNPSGARGAAVNYSGDRTFRSPDEVTIQLRTLALTDSPPPGETYDRVPWFAVSFPDGLSNDWFIET
ncbi:Z1 domain-containing protein [Ruicaihuangia caeni]|uniref:Z1 domain-containing protein n=1 Tax=Ruicaihuangia caeni TaxID=3042517 RepID=A0AAW6T9L5_9MICO|nr:Z1 domain-containing protein [Klugiella sp. YN-L-19]MDI2098322.1 Z1 domain-containing protein [Klugiella sp. YN-L-19]